MNYKLMGYALDFTSFLMEKLDDEALKINQVILFGSVSRGEEGKNSDIDLFIETSDKNIEHKAEEIKEIFYNSIKVKKYWQLLGLNRNINLSVGLLNEWGDLKRSIIANGFVLYGKYNEKIGEMHKYLFVISQGKSRNLNLALWRKLYGYVQKVNKKFYLKKGLIKEYGGEKLANGVFLVPAEHAQKIILFLRKMSFNFKIFPVWSEK